MNIQVQILAKLLGSDTYWLDNEHLLNAEYQVIARKILVFYNKNNKMPSISFLLKFSSGWGSDDEQQTKIDSILEILEDTTQEDMTEDELSELLVEDYKQRNLIPIVKEISNSIVRKDYDMVTTKISQAHSILETGLQINTDTDSRSLLSMTGSKIEMMETGFFPKDNMEISKIPVGSLVLLMAPPKTGKSLLALQGLMQQFYSGLNVYLASYELPLSQLRARIISNVCGVPLNEVQANNFILNESETKVKAFPYTLEYEVDINRATFLLSKGKEEDILSLPKRKNKIMIRAAMTAEELTQIGEVYKPLPNEVELLSEIKHRAKLGILDSFWIDYISEVTQSDGKESREGFITRFSRELKGVCLEYGIVGTLLSQVTNAAYPLQPKYSLALGQICDLQLFLASTPEALKDGIIYLGVGLARHSQGYVYYECARNYATQGIEYMGSQGELNDLLEELVKVHKKKEIK